MRQRSVLKKIIFKIDGKSKINLRGLLTFNARPPCAAYKSSRATTAGVTTIRGREPLPSSVTLAIIPTTRTC